MGTKRKVRELLVKTKKTQKVQYAEDDNHPVQKEIFGNSGMSFNGKGGVSLLVLITHFDTRHKSSMN